MKPTPAHEAFMDTLNGALLTHKDMPHAEMLALASQFVGRLVAIQDQTKYTAAAIMRLVANNVEIGNATAINFLLGDPAGEA